MFKVRRTTSCEVVFTVIGRLEADNVGELSALLAREPVGRTIVLDLRELVLVDRESTNQWIALPRFSAIEPGTADSIVDSKVDVLSVSN